MDKIAVLIPCYNEGQTIAKVVKDYREALPEATQAEMLINLVIALSMVALSFEGTFGLEIPDLVFF